MKINKLAYLKMRANPLVYYAYLLFMACRKKVKWQKKTRWMRLWDYFNSERLGR